eukprot:TRINITY_DN6427_c0_g4_i2.p2 TRINITY_DN6427_c0_g4~~TRINITY_DN6427_c0_g4_i2.p2  ORF type:complete len:232 (+),score=41.99 TRINITY_DN6427_c0_g4_i2:1179-1874(+)
MMKPEEAPQINLLLIPPITKKDEKIISELVEIVNDSFNKVRQALRDCGDNYKQVSPIVKCNTALANSLLNYEKTYNTVILFLNNTEPLLDFLSIIARTSKAYPDLKKEIENGSAELFFVIPRLVVLSSLVRGTKRVYNFHYPLELESEGGQWLYADTKAKLLKTSEKIENLRELLEAELLGRPVSKEIAANPGVEEIIRNIKELGLRLERCRPARWNNFLQVAFKLFAKPR